MKIYMIWIILKKHIKKFVKTQEDKKIFIHVMKNMDKNLDDILKGGN